MLNISDKIIVASGLPRSGTSLLMQLLEAGGIPVYDDGNRKPDANNMKGYYEVEAVKSLDSSDEFLDHCYGKAIKIVSPWLYHLPLRHNYLIIRAVRDIDEVINSNKRFLKNNGTDTSGTDWEGIKCRYLTHMDNIENHLSLTRFPYINVGFNEMINDPDTVSARVEKFLGCNLNKQAMSGTPDNSMVNCAAA